MTSFAAVITTFTETMQFADSLHGVNAVVDISELDISAPPQRCPAAGVCLEQENGGSELFPAQPGQQPEQQFKIVAPALHPGSAQQALYIEEAA